MTSGTRPGSSSFYLRPARTLVVALAAVVASTFVVLALRTPPEWPYWLASLVSIAAFSAPLIAAVVVASVWAGPGRVRSVLFIWRWSDIGLGLAVGLLLRALVELVAPTMGSLQAGLVELSMTDLVVLVLGAALVTPIVEELFFRGVIVAALADSLRGLGRTLAGILAITLSTVVFVLLHAVSLGAATTMATLLGPLLVSVACGILLLVTRRLASALLAHVVFNAIGVGLLLV
ncbi:CPBP family intramembrane glutamic endopeptidase [Microbacterium sp. SLBN-146]|uniref:CPBP family intramembrane glutamic endopeptidase n=1 Tax=Microbacterium sp. SLBN-146 TaxID=2768457 RepID=UPI00114E2EEB|nr:CPBP family intramembrane glutamic endopeptidase [Microbacterium sp. SLBN-146]TQJ29692.1 CAAX prenyl protease-like protein [Microbacterium sp. SLBN-146]